MRLKGLERDRAAGVNRLAKSSAQRRDPGFKQLRVSFGAIEGTRTPTPLPVHGPEPCASANSATMASGLLRSRQPMLPDQEDLRFYSTGTAPAVKHEGLRSANRAIPIAFSQASSRERSLPQQSQTQPCRASVHASRQQWSVALEPVRQQNRVLKTLDEDKEQAKYRVGRVFHWPIFERRRFPFVKKKRSAVGQRPEARSRKSILTPASHSS